MKCLTSRCALARLATKRTPATVTPPRNANPTKCGNSLAQRTAPTTGQSMGGAMRTASGNKMPANGWRKRQIMQWIPSERIRWDSPCYKCRSYFCDGSCKELAQTELSAKRGMSTEKQEPYGYFKYDLRLDAWVKSRDTNRGIAFYTHPPQREPLTDAEMRQAANAMDAEPLAEGWKELIKFARAIEAAHGIKGDA